MADYTMTHTGAELDSAISKVEGDYRDCSGVTASAEDVASGKKIMTLEGEVTGELVRPSGTKSITENGTYDVEAFASASVNVPTGTQRTASDVTVSGASVNIPEGLYGSPVTKTVASGTAGTPVATKSVSGHTATVTPKVTNTTGYIVGGAKSGTPVTVSASELVSGTKTISENGTGIDVTNYELVNVNVPSTEPVLQDKTVTANGEYSADEGYDGLGNVTVNVPAGVSVNKNLLDNWYFGNPANQRGQTSWTAAEYTVDRWKLTLQSDAVCSASLNGGLQVSNIGSGTASVYLNQYFEGISVDGAHTVSVLASDVSGTINLQLAYADGTYSTYTQLVNGITTLTLSGTKEVTRLLMQYYRPGASAKLAAVKLELGSQQTLAHQENGVWVLNEIPDYNEQLGRCMRYFQRFRSGTGYWTQNLPTSAAAYTPAMRANPSISTLTVGGVTYKTATADL